MVNRCNRSHGWGFNNYFTLSSGTLFGMLLCGTVLNEQQNMNRPPHSHCTKCNKTLTLPLRTQRRWQSEQTQRDKDKPQAAAITGTHLWGEDMLRYQHFSDHILSVSTSLTAPNLVIKTHLIKTDVSDRQTYSFCSKLKKIACSTHPICLLVDGAWVMTELDWGEGRACWITMLVSWLPIREWECWCWPWPAWPCSEMFCGEERGEEMKL